MLCYTGNIPLEKDALAIHLFQIDTSMLCCTENIPLEKDALAMYFNLFLMDTSMLYYYYKLFKVLLNFHCIFTLS